MKLTIPIFLFATVFSISAAAAGPKPGSDADRARAARVLFGWGVAAKYDKRSKRITLSYDTAKLDAATLQRYTASYYRPAIRDGNVRALTAMAGHRAKFFGGYDKLMRRDRADGWLLYEPYGRLEICKYIAKQMRSAKLRRRTIDRCRMASALQAGATMYEFRGKPVTWDATKNYGGNLRFADELWKQRADGTHDVLLLVQGFHNVYAERNVRVQLQLLEWIKPRSRYYQLARKKLRKLRSWVARQERKVRALERRQAPRGRKVIFAGRRFGRWTPVKAQRRVASCGRVYWKAFGPRGSTNYLEWSVSVDGKECSSGQFGGKHGRPVVSGENVFSTRKRSCGARVVGVGRHTIVVSVWGTKFSKTGEKYVKYRGNGKFSSRDRYTSSRTNRLAQGRITCRTSNDQLRKRYAAANP